MAGNPDGRAAGWHPAPCPIPTRWAAKVDPAQPLPEHPRPQLIRPTWQNLNGIYDCAVVPAEADRPTTFPDTILVPFPIESSLSGIGRTVTAADRIWYRRRFSAPEAPEGHTWLLHFGAVDWRAEVWLDGSPLGAHEGGFDPFQFNVGALGGEHELIVAAWDPTDDGPHPRGKQALHPPFVVKPVFYTPASGIWQTVWLELVSQTHVGALRVVAAGNEVRIEASIVNAADSDRWHATAIAEGVEVATATGPAGQPLTLGIPHPRRWSPADPYLYDLCLEIIREGRVIDRATSYFGMREVAIRRDERGILRFHLNGAPVFPHGLLDQGYWPDGIFTAPTDEALRFDIEQAKRLGFNLIRKHVKVEPARWYWHCDRIGMLVFQDTPNGDRMTRGIPIGGSNLTEPHRWLGASGIRKDPSAALQFERELASMLAWLQPFPSIVMWVPFNEGWGEFDAARIADKTAALDPTRIVDAASGWVDPGNGDVRDCHIYYPGPRMPSTPDPERAEVLGEWGGLGLEVEGHRWPRRPFAYRRYPNAEVLTEKYQVQFEELARLVKSGLAAAVLTQTTDVEGEVNGLFTYDREILKVDADWLHAINNKILDLA